MVHRVARRYARALFAAAQKAKHLDAVSKDLETVTQGLASDRELRTSVMSPLVARENKRQVVERAFATAGPLTRRLLQLLVEKRREHTLNDVREEFDRLREEQEGILRVTIATAATLPQDLQERVVQRLEQSSGKTVIAAHEVDANLLGGISVQIGDALYDFTVRGELNRLRDRFVMELARQK